MIFPYVRHRVDKSVAIPTGEIARPEVPIRISGPTNTIEILGLIDTGADHVFLSMLLAEVLGVVLRMEEAETAEGAGGQQLRLWPANVELELVADTQSYRWRIQAGFIETGDDPAAAYLGHAGFLEYFTATFDGDAQTVELISNKRIDSDRR